MSATYNPSLHLCHISPGLNFLILSVDRDSVGFWVTLFIDTWATEFYTGRSAGEKGGESFCPFEMLAPSFYMVHG